MNTQLNRVLCLITLIILSFFTSSLFANDLGSPIVSRELVSSDSGDLVKRAFPNYENTKLQIRFENILHSNYNGLDTLKVSKQNELEKVLKLQKKRIPTGLTRKGEKDVIYEFRPTVGKIEFVRNVKQPMKLSRKVGLQRLSKLKKIHADILENMGITEDQIFFKQTSLLVSQSATNPKLGPVKRTEPVVVGVTTDVIRSIDGILVEGSEVKLTTFSENDVDFLTVKWPRFQFAPSIKSYKLKNRSQLEDVIAEKVKSVMGNSRGQVKMAVVLLPIDQGDELTMVPAMKVAVTAVDSGEGVIFYENLLDQELNLEKDVVDSDSGGAKTI